MMVVVPPPAAARLPLSKSSQNTEPSAVSSLVLEGVLYGTVIACYAQGLALLRRASVEYDFSPAPEELLKVLLPQTVKTRLYQCFTDAVVSEQVARMVAMKAATDAAGDMIKNLSRQYNRARQTQITMELLDIVGGVEAIS